MSFEAKIEALSKRAKQHSETIQTEEAAKTSIIMPFLQSLGYDVFDPSEVVPEFTADTYSRKGEKVDYAILRDGAVAILVECKGLSTQLNEKHLGQLYRYFSVTEARFAILTNGREFRFYSDLEESNKLDKRPFFTFDIFEYSNSAVAELGKFKKEDFSVDGILEQAERLKYVSLVKRLLAEWMEAPSDAFVKAVASEVHDGRLNTQVRSCIEGAIPSAFKEIVRERLRARFSSVLDDGDAPEPETLIEQDSAPEIETTQEEMEGWLSIRSMVSQATDPKRIAIRDAKSYCAILLDDNNRKPIARLHFNRKQKYVGLFDGEAEDRQPIENVSDIFSFSERIHAAIRKYE